MHDTAKRTAIQGLSQSVRFGQSSSIAIAADAFDLAEPNSLAIAVFIKLADLRAQHAPQMMRRFALHDGGFARKLLHEESSTHAEILA